MTGRNIPVRITKTVVQIPIPQTSIVTIPEITRDMHRLMQNTEHKSPTPYNMSPNLLN